MDPADRTRCQDILGQHVEHARAGFNGCVLLRLARWSVVSSKRGAGPPVVASFSHYLDLDDLVADGTAGTPLNKLIAGLRTRGVTVRAACPHDERVLAHEILADAGLQAYVWTDPAGTQLCTVRSECVRDTAL